MSDLRRGSLIVFDDEAEFNVLIDRVSDRPVQFDSLFVRGKGGDLSAVRSWISQEWGIINYMTKVL
jgi:hypothetical protein